MTTLSQLGKISSDEVKKRWDEVLDEMYGNENARKAHVVEVLLQNSEITPEVKAWLKQLTY